MTVTSLNSYSFSFNNLVFGGTNSPFQILEVNGLEDLPDIRVQDDNRGYIDGMFTGRDFLSGRYLTMTIQILGDSNNSMVQNVALLKNNLIPQTAGTNPLQFQIPGSNLQVIYARVRKRTLKIDPEFTYGKSIAVVQFFAPDPRIYDWTVQSTDLATSSFNTGRTYNRVYTAAASYGAYPYTTGMSFGGGTATQNIILNNGNTTTYPTITITGPAVNPKIINASTGQYLQINYNMSATDTLVIDTDFRTVTLDGVARRSILSNSSSWFGAAPGTSFYTFNATGTGSTTTCVVRWQSAYIQENK